MRFTRRAALIATTYFAARALALPRPPRSSYSVVNVDGSGSATTVPTTVYETTTRVDRHTVTPSPLVPDTVTIDHPTPTVTVNASPSTLTVTTSIPTTIPTSPGSPPPGAPTSLPFPPGPPPNFSAPPPGSGLAPSAPPVPSPSPVEQVTTSAPPVQPAATSAPPVPAWSATETFNNGLWQPSSTRSYDDGMWHSTYVKRASTGAPYPISTAAYESGHAYGTGAYYPLMPTGGYYGSSSAAPYYGSSSAPYYGSSSAPYGTGAYSYPSAVPTGW